MCVCIPAQAVFQPGIFSDCGSGREFSLSCAENEDKELQNIEWFTEYYRILNGFEEEVSLLQCRKFVRIV